MLASESSSGCTATELCTRCRSGGPEFPRYPRQVAMALRRSHDFTRARCARVYVAAPTIAVHCFRWLWWKLEPATNLRTAKENSHPSFALTNELSLFQCLDLTLLSNTFTISLQQNDAFFSWNPVSNSRKKTMCFFLKD